MSIPHLFRCPISLHAGLLPATTRARSHCSCSATPRSCQTPQPHPACSSWGSSPCCCSSSSTRPRRGTCPSRRTWRSSARSACCRRRACGRYGAAAAAATRRRARLRRRDLLHGRAGARQRRPPQFGARAPRLPVKRCGVEHAGGAGSTGRVEGWASGGGARARRGRLGAGSPGQRGARLPASDSWSLPLLYL
jgi:hypothetical protein